MERTAVLSACGAYRYLLTRTWDSTSPAVTFVMLNPSTADAELDDPTLRRCLGFAYRWGAGGLRVVNLYALRSTDPAALRMHPDPVGPDDDSHLADALTAPGVVVAAWGAKAGADRVEQFDRLAADRPVVELGRTRSGHPRHPLYVRADTIPLPRDSRSASSCTVSGVVRSENGARARKSRETSEGHHRAPGWPGAEA